MTPYWRRRAPGQSADCGARALSLSVSSSASLLSVALLPYIAQRVYIRRMAGSRTYFSYSGLLWYRAMCYLFLCIKFGNSSNRAAGNRTRNGACARTALRAHRRGTQNRRLDALKRALKARTEGLSHRWNSSPVRDKLLVQACRTLGGFKGNG